jgi:branched-chain amino acid transport system permease protein
MHFDAQQIINGLAVGSIYGAVALALVLIFRSTGVINFAQGEMATFTTFIAWTFIIANGWNYWIGFVLTLVVAFILGAGVERVIIRPVEKAPELAIVIVTLGLFIVFNSLSLGIWQSLPKSFPPAPLFKGGSIHVGNLFISRPHIGVFISSLIVMALIFLFFRYTKVGLAMRAATLNPTAASLMGVNVDRMLMIGWGLSAAVGATAGIFTANLILLDPNMMFGVLIYAFAAAVLGGLTSPIGAVVGGLLVGVLESLAGTTSIIGSDLKTPVAFLVIVLVLLVRPSGLFGRARVSRV